MPQPLSKNIGLGLFALAVLTLGLVLLFTSTRAGAIASFEECARAGYPVSESHPRQCRTPDGRLFIESVAESLSSSVSSGLSSSSSSCAASNSTNIRVFRPCPHQEVTMPVVIAGEARVFENAFSYRIRDADGSILLEGHDTANAPDIGFFGPFTVSLSYPKPKGTTGTVEVFTYSAKDGSQIDTVTIPVRFAAGIDSMQVDLYFPNANDDPDVTDCSRVRAVKRWIPRDARTARHALEELLRGPSILDIGQGFTTSIPQGVTMQRLAIENGVAEADFSIAIETGGSCRVIAIRSQIARTLKQFPSVQSVVISVNGNAEEALQP